MKIHDFRRKPVQISMVFNQKMSPKPMENHENQWKSWKVMKRHQVKSYKLFGIILRLLRAQGQCAFSAPISTVFRSMKSEKIARQVIRNPNSRITVKTIDFTLIFQNFSEHFGSIFKKLIFLSIFFSSMDSSVRTGSLAQYSWDHFLCRSISIFSIFHFKNEFLLIFWKSDTIFPWP